jgi:hypothetical protein
MNRLLLLMLAGPTPLQRCFLYSTLAGPVPHNDSLEKGCDREGHGMEKVQKRFRKGSERVQKRSRKGSERVQNGFKTPGAAAGLTTGWAVADNGAPARVSCRGHIS